MLFTLKMQPLKLISKLKKKKLFFIIGQFCQQREVSVLCFLSSISFEIYIYKSTDIHLREMYQKLKHVWMERPANFIWNYICSRQAPKEKNAGMTYLNEMTFPVHDPRRNLSASVHRCCSSAGSPVPPGWSTLWEAVVSIPVETARTGAEQGQRWWCGEMSPSAWATRGIPVPWQSVQATPVEASGSWMYPQGSSRLWGQECRTRHRWCSNAVPAWPSHRPSALLSLGSTNGVTAVVLLPRNSSWNKQELLSPTALLILTHAGC